MPRPSIPAKPKSNKSVIVLLVGGLVILAVAGVLLYSRMNPKSNPEPEPPKEPPKIDVPAPLVVAQKQPPIEAKTDAGPAVATEEEDTDAKKPHKPKGGSVEKMGKIDSKAVNKYINARFGQVRTCYERRLKINPLLAGKVDLNIGIGLSGKAKSISVTKDTVGDQQMISCVKGVIRSWSFPKPEGGKVIIAKQFTFKKKL
jgi:hypothetical protein